MAIKKYFATKDNTITNCYESNLIYRATGSNAGLSDTLQVFSIHGQASTSSQEKARSLLFWEVDDITDDRTDGIVPASGSCKFYMNLYNCPHPFSVPKNFTLCVSALSESSWDEGTGVNDDEWVDKGPVNWNQASTSSGTPVYWTITGSTFCTGVYEPGTAAAPTYTQYFTNGLENLRIEVTSVVEEMIATTVPNYGFIVYLTSSNEDATTSYYIKKFFGRGSEYFFKVPTITCEWDDSITDDRGFFYASSSLASSTDNTNKISFYNKIRNSLKTIPGITSSNIYLRLYDDRYSGSLLTTTTDPITGGFAATGIYTASIILNTTSSIVYDRWYNRQLGTCYYTGSISVKFLTGYGDNQEPNYIISMPNLKSSYKTNEKPRLKVFTRDKNWTPNIYTIANSDAEFTLIKNMYYRVRRSIDNFVCVDYGTGSLEITKLSYDVSSSYFDFDMNNLEPDYMYEFNYIYKKSDDTNYEELPNTFKFRVERQQY